MGGRSPRSPGSRAARALISIACAGALLHGAAPAREAQAFCGFYVGGADRKLFNNATLVVLLRDGTRTVLSMQNNYQGPPENFAMVVPVPVVLQKENVKTLPREVFDHIDQLAAPRLVEYWEQDPCAPDAMPPMPMRARAAGAAPPGGGKAFAEDYGVKIEAQFTVGEYEIVILSAEDSGGLDRWLKDSGYKIPDGAEPLLRPYVQSGSKFFVAKVDVSKVKMDKGMAMLSPLRFHYDSEQFSLPVRLGLANSSGTQDLIVHILARGQRYELANYKNVTIPTNIDIDEKAKDQFPAFYAALFDRTLEENMDSDKRPPVVTEYSWDAGTCDPCPGPPLQPNDVATLGADTLAKPDDAPRPAWGAYRGFVVTRLHARYSKDQLAEDLVFKAAEPITGGREVFAQQGASREPKLETGATKASVNNFQGRYAIRHPWTGPVTCASPKRGRWGGPPAGQAGGRGATPARDLAFAPRGGVQLASLVKHDVPEIRLKAQAATEEVPGSVPIAPASRSGCGACRAGGGEDGGVSKGALATLLALAMGLFMRRRGSESRG
jgi:hypothetical protein